MKIAVARSRKRRGEDFSTFRRLLGPLTRFAFTFAERDTQSQDDAVDVVEVADALGEIEDRAIVKPDIPQRFDIAFVHLLRGARERPCISHQGLLAVGAAF